MSKDQFHHQFVDSVVRAQLNKHSVASICRELGIKRSRFYRWESGRCAPPLELARIAVIEALTKLSGYDKAS
jgi:hypothetical protein